MEASHLIDFSNCTERELWEYVAIHLSRLGIKNVLVGGAVVALIWTNGGKLVVKIRI